MTGAVLNTSHSKAVVFNTVANRKRPHFVGVWLSTIGREGIDEIAHREGLDTSAALRLMIAFAVRRMPKGWRP